MPLAAGLLKAQLDSIPEISSRLDVYLMDFYSADSAESISGSIINEIPDLVGFSTYLWNRQLTEEICRIIRKKMPEAILFAGGAEATGLPLNLLHSAPFDFIIKGEGELPLSGAMKQIIDDKPFKDIPGVFHTDMNTENENSQFPVDDLNSLPSPFLTGVIDLKKYPGVLWELSRGCPFRCSFCFESRGVAGVRQFSLTRLRKELELFESEKVNQVFVLDPTFNRDMNRAKQILRMIMETAPLIHFTFEVRTEYLDEEMAVLFSEINCSLQIGLQSAIPEVLSRVNRKIDPDKYADKISLLNSSGVIFGLDLIYGLPGDTIGGFRQSLNYALTLQPNSLDIFPLAVLPGTALHDEADSFRLNFLRYAPYTLISSPLFSESDMAEAESLANACNIFYNLGGAAGWMFMVLETLGLEPTDLLDRFAMHLSSRNKNTGFSQDEITVMQLSFVKELFAEYNKSSLFPVMDNLIQLHGAMNRSLYAGPHAGVAVKTFSDNTVFKLSPGTITVALKYNFNDLMTVGEFDLEEFLMQYRPEKTCVIIYNCSGGVKSLIVDRNIFDLLQAFSGTITLKEIFKRNSSMNKDEAYEFIEYALSETIIHSF
jgi:radical SAM superfamily enzyme YgiQ (UPF0313 family)